MTLLSAHNVEAGTSFFAVVSLYDGDTMLTDPVETKKQSCDDDRVVPFDCKCEFLPCANIPPSARVQVILYEGKLRWFN